VITIEDIRRFATAFPQVQETTHFRLQQPVFKVNGKTFAGMDKGGRSVVVCISQTEAAAIVARDSVGYEEVWRPGARSFVGLRVTFADVPAERVQELLEQAWRTRAPKRLVAAYDAG
jgi:hypothetical protein